MNNQANIGNFWDWLGTASNNVDNALNDVAPIIQNVKQTFGPSPATNYTPVNTVTYPLNAQPVYYNNPSTANTSNNTLLYIGLAAAAVVAIILLNKK